MTNNNTSRLAATAGIAIGPILFVVAILAVLVGAIAAGSGGFTGSATTESVRVRASVLIQQANNIKTATDRVIVNGTGPTAIIVAESPATPTSSSAIYTTAGGGITPQNPPAGSVPTGSTWRFVLDADLPGIGAADGDFIAVIQVTEQTCEALNNIIFGTGVLSSIPSLGTTPDVTIAAAAAGDNVTPAGNAFDQGGSPDTEYDGRINACVADGTDYYFYQLLSAG
ncbi:MAG: hypothetical protein AB7G06_08145 [Bdellovibrionales bacterium]